MRQSQIVTQTVIPTLATTSRTWTPIVDENLARALTISRHIASRLCDEDRVAQGIAAVPKQTAYPRSVHWQGHGIAQGEAGLALALGHLDNVFPDENWDTVAHHYLSKGARSVERQPYLSSSLSSGLAGFAYAAWTLSRGGLRYQRLLSTLDAILLPEAMRLARQVNCQRNGLSVNQYDLISGLAGIGAYLLCRRTVPVAFEALQTVLSALIQLADEEEGLPRWHTPARLLNDESMQSQYPHGNLNCGLAHGIPGPLAILALAQLAGVTIEGMPAAIDYLAEWLMEHQIHDSWGINWPIAVPLRNPTPGTVTVAALDELEVTSSRAAWCYGSPGVARSLWLAGTARGRETYRTVAVSAMEAVYRRPVAERRIDSATFCHGVAGLLQITLRFAHDTKHPLFTAAARTLRAQLLALYEPATLLGYRNVETQGHSIDQPGLLDGAPGPMLVLLASATDVEPVWDRLFLLS